MKYVINILIILMLSLASGAYFKLIKDGGAHEQGLTVSSDRGLLDQLPRYWGIFTVCFVAGALRFRKNRKYPLAIAPIVLAAGCLLSALWAQYPIDALRVSLLLLASVGLIHVQISRLGFQRSIQFVGSSFWIINLSSLLAIIFIPSYGVSVGEHAGKWQGVFDHKNGLGDFAALSLLLCVWQLKIRQSMSLALQALLAITLVVGSRSSSGAAVVGIVILCWLATSPSILERWFISSRKIFLLGLMALMAVELYASIAAPSYSLLSAYVDTTYTGRLAIWLSVIDEIARSPWVGHGVGQFLVTSIATQGGDLTQALGFVVGSTHNGYLDIIYSLGLSGFFLLLFFIYKKINRKDTFYGHFMTISFFSSWMALNFLESKLVDFNIYFIIFIYVMYFSDAREQKTGAAR